MTREEACEVLERIHKYIYVGNELFEAEKEQALNMAIEALKDRPKGEWTKATESIWKCSLCNCVMYVDSNYCPFCGAKMGGERSE